MSYEIKKLLPRHYMVMDLLILGLKQKQIAEKIGLSEQAVSSIVRSKVFRDELPKRLAKVMETPGQDGISTEQLLREKTREAAERLCELLDSKEDRVALRAAQDILDRAGYGKVKRPPRKHVESTVIDEKAIKRLEQCLDEIRI